MSESVQVKVPATSANLGAGYDVLAAALSLHIEVDAVEAEGFSIDPGDAVVPADKTNLIVRAFKTICPADGIAITVKNEIPIGKGLGSSAAAIVAGIRLAGEWSGAELSDDQVFDRALALEGHPDNIAAAIYGGFVVCTPGSANVQGPAGQEGAADVTGSDQYLAAKIDPPEGLAAVVAVPEEQLPTEEARAAVPAVVDIGDAVFTSSTTAMLVLALERGGLELLPNLLRDRLHQPARAYLYPKSMDLISKAAEVGALGATISGAGPSVLFWCESEKQFEVAEKVSTEAPDTEVTALDFMG